MRNGNISDEGKEAPATFSSSYHLRKRKRKGETWELLHPIYEGYLVPVVRCQVRFLECGCRTANSTVVFFVYFLHYPRENNTKETFRFGLNFYLETIDSLTNVTINTPWNGLPRAGTPTDTTQGLEHRAVPRCQSGCFQLKGEKSLVKFP